MSDTSTEPDEEEQFDERAERDLIGTLRPVGWLGKVWMYGLLLLVCWGLAMWIYQIRSGLHLTDMRDNVSWGLYIATFVFYIGISHVGALMSAILRMTGARWRNPITRMAESITFASLFMGGMMPLVDLGRIDRVWYIFVYGRLQSPVVWDVISVTTYFVGSSLFLFIPMIPDFGRMRDYYRRDESETPWPAWRLKISEILSLNWYGTEKQHERLERCLHLLTVIILPVAISVHTVVSWIFAMTLRGGWHSTIFGPYFVAGALMSGAASVIIAMALFRWAYGLEEYITEDHFNYMGLLVLVLTVVYAYFTLNEYMPYAYHTPKKKAGLIHALFSGEWATTFWVTNFLGVGVPIFVLAFRKGRTYLPLAVTACFLNVIFAWVKRFLIVVPPMQYPYLPIVRPEEWLTYFPTFVEWSIVMGSLAGFALIYTLVSRVVPIVSLEETIEAVEEHGTDEVGLKLTDKNEGEVGS